MATRKLPKYWVVVVETFMVSRYGPYFNEREVDDEAKKIFQDILSESPKRAQKIRSMLLLEMVGDDVEVSLYEPKFVLDMKT